MSKCHVRRVYVRHPQFAGLTAWLIKDLGSHLAWAFDRADAIAYERNAAEALLLEAKRCRPDDIYELEVLS